jgi:endonuclease III
MEARTQAATVLRVLRKAYPAAKIMLRHENAMQLLVAVMLSAQCTDKRVNIVTQSLFKKYKTADDFASADLREFEQEIYSTGFYRNKAKNIIAAAQMIQDRFGGKIPATMEDMLLLPGVARKTANIVLSNVHGVLAGIGVDTHVKRLSFRLGLSVHTNPEKIENDLMQLYPLKEWNKVTYLLIEHGRAVCKARVPACSRCVLNKMCPKNGVEKQG